MGLPADDSLRMKFLSRFRDAFRAWCLPPVGRVVAMALLGAIVSSYPVLFSRASFVSPHYGSPLLYDGLPALPGSTKQRHCLVNGSDVGAMMWQHVPYSMLEHRALATGPVWPVWNRSNSAGVPLLGQGQTMFGDPLHWLVIAANGASWAWDVKFVVAKWLLAIVLGLLVWELTAHLPAALLVSGVAPFAGVFVYYVNHPALFSFCYAAWPLYCWLRVTRAVTLRDVAGWAAGLLVANFALLSSGTVKEAYVGLLVMNFTGAIVLSVSVQPWRVRLGRLLGLAWVGVIFVLLTMPAWGSFLATLRVAYTSSDAPAAMQVQPAMLLGAFDEALFRPANSSGNIYNPSASFVVLAGLLYFLAALPAVRPGRTVWVLGAVALAGMALVFGVIPEAWIVRVPFIGRLIHIDDIGISLLVLLWTVLAGVGFAAAARRLGTPAGRGDLWRAGLLLAGLVLWYLLGARVIDRAQFWAEGRMIPGARLNLSGFVGGYLALILTALVVWVWVVRRALVRGRLLGGERWALILCGVMLLWRQGLHAEAWFTHYTVRAAPRVNFHAISPAVQAVQADLAQAGPARAIGFGRNLFPGWQVVYGLEGINGPDALMSSAYRELLQASPLAREWDWRYFVDPPSIAGARAFLDFLNVRYYFARPAVPAAEAAGLRVQTRADLVIYTSPTAWPRAFFVDRLEVYRQPAELMQRILTGNGRPFAAITAAEAAVHVQLGSLIRAAAAPVRGEVVACRLRENGTELEVQAGGPGMVVLTETFWPGYSSVRIDGEAAEPLRVNHAFHGFLIPSAGRHRIEVTYAPPGFARMKLAAGGGLLLLLATGLAVGVVVRRQSPA